MPHEFTTAYLKDSLSLFHYYKKLAERAMEQVSDLQLFEVLDDEMNSIAIIVKHMAGNMRSRWTDFLSPSASRAELLRVWDAGWKCVFDALEPLSESDLTRRVTIRGEEHSVMQAVNRQIAHYAYHVGQIVFLAKHFQQAGWKSLTVPRNRSAEFNQRVLNKEASQR